MNKLQWEHSDVTLVDGKPAPGYWANRPRNVANLTRFASRQLEARLNWQVVSLDVESSDWLDAPVLYIASHQAPGLTDAEYEKLRQYVEAGGIIFTHADAGQRVQPLGAEAGGEDLSGPRAPAAARRPLPVQRALQDQGAQAAASGGEQRVAPAAGSFPDRPGRGVAAAQRQDLRRSLPPRHQPFHLCGRQSATAQPAQLPVHPRARARSRREHPGRPSEVRRQLGP